MASENTKRLYKHYLSIAPRKERQAAELLLKFPELVEKEKVSTRSEEVKSDGKKPKR